jgi:hypothetical protein
MKTHNNLDQGEVKQLFEQQIMQITAKAVRESRRW